MLCPDCGEQTKILQTRLMSGGSVKRRRECLDCEKRFTSVETCLTVPALKAYKQKIESEEVGSAPPDLSKLWR